MSSLLSGVSAITNGVARFERASQSLLRASAGDESADAAGAIVEQISAKHQVAAGAATVRLADDMYKALLEIGRD